MLAPLVLMLVLGIVQLGLWGYGRTVVVDAASAAAEEAAPLTATSADGTSVGLAIVERAGLMDVSVQVDAGADEVVALVSARVPGLIDLGGDQVSARVSRAKERVT